MSLLAVFLLCSLASAQVAKPLFTLEIAAGDTDRANEIVSVLLPAGVEDDVVKLVSPDGKQLMGQVSTPALHVVSGDEEMAEKRQLTFVMPALVSGETLTLFGHPTGDVKSAAPEFRWDDNGESEAALMIGDRNVMTYMYTPLDDSTEEKRGETYKVYHRVYSPDGNQVITKGPGGKFPHHRGLFYGFNKLSYDGKTADVWHCKKGAHQSHEDNSHQIAGPVFGRHQVQIAWRGTDGEPFAMETREMTAYKIGGATLIEFNSRLESTGSKVVMKGDPQHAGFQFRAAQSVADVTGVKTFYIRPDGKGKPGEFRNWNADKKKMTEADATHVNLPWNAMNFWVGDENYTCCYLDLDTNPKESRFSERDYGRFGSYFEYELTPDKPLDLRYRVWLQDGEMTVEEVEAISAGFRNPAAVSVK